VQASFGDLVFAGFDFNWILDRERAIYTIFVTGVGTRSWIRNGAAARRARSVDQDLVKAAQIDARAWRRIYRRILIPSIWPIMIAVVVILLQVRDRLRPRSGADGRHLDSRPTSGDLRL